MQLGVIRAGSCLYACQYVHSCSLHMHTAFECPYIDNSLVSTDMQTLLSYHNIKDESELEQNHIIEIKDTENYV